MEADRLYRFIQNPSLLSGETLTELQTLTERFPWFSTARLLYLKNLAVLKDTRLSAELKRSAVYVPDRRKLFLLLEGERYELDALFDEKAVDGSDDPFALIDAFLSACPGEAERTGAPLLFHPSASSDYLHWSLSEAPETSAEDKASAPPLQHQDLIDSFLKKEETRSAGKGKGFGDDLTDDAGNAPEAAPPPASVEELEEAHLKPLDDSYFTETLARIYVKQKRYEKALQIIKNLSLNYPEKNVYFADQIRFLEKLIINTKK